MRADDLDRTSADQATQKAKAGAPTLTDQVLGHGLMRMMYQPSRLLFWKGRRGPSSRTFSLALLQIIAPPQPNERMSDIRGAIRDCEIIPAGTKSVLVSMASDTVKDRDALRAEIELWFDSAMDRVSGWYKRRTPVVTASCPSSSPSGSTSIR